MAQDTPSMVSFRDDRADFIVRSFDGVDFRVQRSVLVSASSIFEDMFMLPPPPPGAAEDSGLDGSYIEGLPFVQLVEHSRTVQHVIQSCYQSDEFILSEYSDLAHLADAGSKYDMPSAINVVKHSLLRKAQTDPFPALAFVCRYGWADTAASVARLWLRQPVLDWPPYPPELKNLSADVFCRLVAYRNACAKVAMDILCDLDWLRDNPDINEMTVSCAACCSATSTVSCSSTDPGGGYVTRYRVAGWYEQYILRFLPVLRGTPWGTLALHPAVLHAPPSGSSNICGTCEDQTYPISRLLEKAIEQAIDEVGVEFDFC